MTGSLVDFNKPKHSTSMRLTYTNKHVFNSPVYYIIHTLGFGHGDVKFNSGTYRNRHFGKIRLIMKTKKDAFPFLFDKNRMLYFYIYWHF